MNLIEAVRDALRVEMRRDPRVVVLGEDVGRFGGVFRATEGLQEEFGPERCIDTPLAESGIVGTAIGMALYGMRPVPEIQFGDYIYPGLRSDRERAGQASLSLGRRVLGARRHSHARRRRHQGRPLPLAVARGASSRHIPGIKVVCPSNPYDAKGLLASAIRGEDPVIFMEPKDLLPQATRRGSRGRVHDSARRGQGRSRGEAGHGDRLVGHGATGARGGRRRGRRRGTIWR